VQPLEKREGELTYRAAGLEKRGHNGAALQGFAKRRALSVKVSQFKIGCFVSSSYFGHRLGKSL
jgi:hypothetical protein